MFLVRCTLVLLLASTVVASDAVPDWALEGILSVESASYYEAAPGTRIVYVDKRIGAAGERGPFQMTRIAFDQIARSGESFTRLGTDTRYAEGKARAYLLWLYEGPAQKNWERAIGMYNTGPTGYYRNRSTASRYTRSVKLASG